MNREFGQGFNPGKESRSFSASNGGADGPVPARPRRIVSPDGQLPTAAVDRRGNPKFVPSGDNRPRSAFLERPQGRVERTILRGVEAVRSWREGRRGAESGMSSGGEAPQVKETPRKPFVDDTPTVPIPVVQPEGQGQQNKPKDIEPITEPIPVVEPDPEVLAQAEDDALVRTMDYLLTEAKKGDTRALEQAGRLMQISELRGGNVMGRIDRLGNQGSKNPAAEPSERDLELIDGVLTEFTTLSIAEVAGLQDQYPDNDFDDHQHKELTSWTRGKLEKAREKRRQKEQSQN